jgi:hypothetical protein
LRPDGRPSSSDVRHVTFLIGVNSVGAVYWRGKMLLFHI